MIHLVVSITYSFPNNRRLLWLGFRTPAGGVGQGDAVRPGAGAGGGDVAAHAVTSRRHAMQTRRHGWRRGFASGGVCCQDARLPGRVRAQRRTEGRARARASSRARLSPILWSYGVERQSSKPI